MPEPSKISLEWEYYVFVIIPFPGVSWDVCGADPLLGSQSGWKLVKLPLPEHLKLSTLKGSAAVLKEVLYNFFNQFRQAVFFRADIRWVEGLDMEPLPATPPASTKRYWQIDQIELGRVRPIFNQIAESLTRPTHWPLWKEFWHPKLPRTWNWPIIGYPTAIP